ncbi:MAG: 50S ribosomal protein L10 [Halobacteriales archaeon]|nr:50S ribosomal protein L10 [Halobacteriales archaeon]
MSAETERKTEQVPQWKKDEVDELVTFIGSHDSVGVVDVTGIPSRQLQAMRAELHGKAAVRMSRNSLVHRALDEVDDGVETLVGYVTGQVALIATDSNPFALFQQLEASKTPAPINEGEVAPNDIVIPEGDTGMDPGPFVGELQNVGAQAQIMEGSIKVTADSTVAEAGETVSADLASVLAELGIEPKEVGLDLRAVYADGTLFEAEELAIDVDEYRADVQAAVAGGRNLAVNAAIATDQSAPLLLSKARGEAVSLALHAAIETPDLADELVARADAQVRALAAHIDDEEALPEALRGDAETAAPAAPETEEPTDDQTDDDTEPAEADDADASDSDDEDDEAGADALGDMFG